VIATLPEQVDLELPAPLLDRQRLDRRVDRDPSVVDQRSQGPPIPVDPVGDPGEVLGDGDVENHGLQPLRGESVSVRLAPNYGEHVQPACREASRRRLSYSRRGTGDQRDLIRLRGVVFARHPRSFLCVARRMAAGLGPGGYLSRGSGPTTFP
jgi:hypothetical protein